MSGGDTRLIILDDTYEGINFNGNWFRQGNPERELNGTTHITQTPGASFSITFEGNSIGVYGTLDANVGPQSSYVLDGQSPVVYNVTESFTPQFEGPFLYAAAFYKSPRLEYGTHTLRVTVDRWNTGLTGYIFDFLTIGVRNETNSDLVIVDESDSAVEYSGHWTVEGSPAYEYQGTTHKSSAAGAAAMFQFNGTAIDVFGTIRGSSDQFNPLISFQIDDGDKGYYQTINTEGILRPKVRFYSSGGLSEGLHTLRIESVGSSEFWLDYFIYKPLSASSGSSSSPPSSPSSSPNSPSVASRPEKAPTGAIAGGVVGGVALIALIAFLILFYRRRKSAKRTIEQQNGTVTTQNQGGSMGHPSLPTNSPPMSNSFSPSYQVTTPPSLHDVATIPSLAITPYRIEHPHDAVPRASSSGTGTRMSTSYQSSSAPQVVESPRFVSPIPQKYSTPAGPVHRVDVFQHDLSSSSAYTGSDVRDTRSPPPNYSAADGSIVRY